MDASSAVAWPFAIGGNIAERLEWLTDILDPPYGPAQTRKLRTAPRTFLQFDGLEKADTRRWMETLLHANAAGVWHVPLAADAIEIQTPLLSGATVIPVDTLNRRFVVGGNAIIQGKDPRAHQILVVSAVASGSITVSTPLLQNWPVGTSVTPTIGAKLANPPQLERFTGDDVPYAVTFRADEPMDWTASFGTALYRTLPVFEMAVDWGGNPAYSPERRIAELDAGTGKVRTYDQAGMAIPSIRVEMALATRESAATFRSLVYALSGRWQPIWVSSLSRDLEIKAINSTTAIDVAWSGFSQWPVTANRRDIRIERSSGLPFYRRIVSANAIDAATERLVLDTALPAGFVATDATLISFMALCRQDSDTNLLRIWSREVLMSELAFQGVINDL